MSMIDAIPLLAGAGADGGYQISRSVRLRSSASAYFNRTFTTPTNVLKWSWSGWVKRGQIGVTYAPIFAGGTSGSAYAALWFNNDNLVLYSYNGATVYQLTTSAVYRDPSAWYHIQIAFDSTQATASNRLAMYVNGVQITTFAAATYPSLNYSGFMNSAIAHYFGQFTPALGASYFDGYLTEVNFIDGQALTPSSFGETNAVTGVWQPKRYAGTYGTNGFYLNFSDNSGVTATTIGKDYSGNGNNWTPSAGISITAGVTYDSMLDVPTLYADGGNGRGNYATWNPLWRLGGSGYITPTNGNLRASIGSTNNIIASTIQLPSSGKWYMELTLTTGVYAEYGLCNSTASGGGTNGGVFGSYYNGVNQYAIGPGVISDGNQAWVTGDVGLIAVDVSNNKLWIGRIRSGTTVWMGGGNPSSGTSPSFSASGGGGVYATTFDAQTFNNPFVASGGGADVWDANFGQQPFIGTPPTGFKALNTQNLPDATIKKGNLFFNTATWSSDIVNPTIGQKSIALGFQPDLVWSKNRDNAESHYWMDSVRGDNAGNKWLRSNATAAEGADALGSTTASYVFNSTGFDIVDTNSASGEVYFNNGSASTPRTYVGWAWNAGGTSTNITVGQYGTSPNVPSIASTVRANPTAGFSVVTYTGTGANATVGHGLGVVPRMIIVKSRSLAGQNWHTYHAAIDATSPANYIVILNGTVAKTTSAASWNNTAPTSNVFSIGTDTSVNNSTSTYVAYCFAAVAGYSAFGSYTGNGSADGPFVFLGFRPRFVMVKRTDTTNQWMMFDTSRSAYNQSYNYLMANLADAEAATSGSTDTLDFLSNGFKLRGTTTAENANGGTYIYACFAENPFKLSLAR